MTFSTAHEAILDLGIAMGYSTTIKNFRMGVCHGVAVSWMNACLIHEEAKFNRRIERIISEGSSLVQQMADVNEKVKAKQPLTEGEDELMEMMAMYDSIALHQDPQEFPELFAMQGSRTCDLKNII